MISIGSKFYFRSSNDARFPSFFFGLLRWSNKRHTPPGSRKQVRKQTLPKKQTHTRKVRQGGETAEAKRFRLDRNVPSTRTVGRGCRRQTLTKKHTQTRKSGKIGEGHQERRLRLDQNVHDALIAMQCFARQRNGSHYLLQEDETPRRRTLVQKRAARDTRTPPPTQSNARVSTTR